MPRSIALDPLRPNLTEPDAAEPPVGLHRVPGLHEPGAALERLRWYASWADARREIAASPWDLIPQLVTATPDVDTNPLGTAKVDIEAEGGLSDQPAPVATDAGVPALVDHGSPPTSAAAVVDGTPLDPASFGAAPPDTSRHAAHSDHADRKSVV